MKTILIIENDPAEMKAIMEICSRSSQGLTILTAEDEKNSRLLLSDKCVDLVICATSFPDSSSCSVLKRIVLAFPYIPLIAIAPTNSVDKADLLSLGVSAVYEKPFDGELLVEKLGELIERSSIGTINGIPTHSFLQMLENEGKSCTLQVLGNNSTGRIFIREGTPVDAETGVISGEKALYEIISWDDVTLEIKFYNGQRECRIEKPLMSLIMEGLRLKDERDNRVREKPAVVKPRHKLKQVSTAGQRLALEFGLSLKLEFEDLDSSLDSSLAGMVPEKCIIVATPPSFIFTSTPLERGSAILVKYRYMGKLCLFNSRLLRAIDTPQHLLFLEYPEVIHYHEMRKAVRTATYIPCAVRLSGDQQVFGAFIDMSSSGGLCQIKSKNNKELPEVKIKEKVELSCLLPGLSGEQKITGIIRNMRKSSHDVHIGMQFTQLPAHLKEAIERYLSSGE
jgi:DNA-binding response OmpR family regulator